MSVRNARIENRQEFESELVNRTLDTEVVSSRNIGIMFVRKTLLVGMTLKAGPIFLVKEAPGVFVTKCDIFFRTKDDGNTPVKFQSRTMKDGFPTQMFCRSLKSILIPMKLILQMMELLLPRIGVWMLQYSLREKTPNMLSA